MVPPGAMRTRLGHGTRGRGFVDRNADGTLVLVPGDLPLRAPLVVDVPTAATGQCGETDFANGACRMNGAGSTAHRPASAPAGSTSPSPNACASAPASSAHCAISR